jgi:hypothetical protein
MLAPLLIINAAATGGYGAADLGFSRQFTDVLGASPLFLTLVAVAAFYALAMLRKVPFAAAALTLTLAALIVCGRETFDLDSLCRPQPLPVLLIGLLQAGLALRRRSWLRGLVAAAIFISAASIHWRWVFIAAWHGYIEWRHTIAGLDQMVGGIAVLLLAVLVSLSKIGIPRRWFARFWRKIIPLATTEPATGEPVPHDV